MDNNEAMLCLEQAEKLNTKDPIDRLLHGLILERLRQAKKDGKITIKLPGAYEAEASIRNGK